MFVFIFARCVKIIKKNDKKLSYTSAARAYVCVCVCVCVLQHTNEECLITQWRHYKKDRKLVFQLSLSAGKKYCREHSAILSTFILLPFVIKIFALPIFEKPFYTGFTVNELNTSKAMWAKMHRKYKKKNL